MSKYTIDQILAPPPEEAPSGLGQRLRDRFDGLGAAEFVVPARSTPDFEWLGGLEEVNPWADDTQPPGHRNEAES